MQTDAETLAVLYRNVSYVSGVIIFCLAKSSFVRDQTMPGATMQVTSRVQLSLG